MTTKTLRDFQTRQQMIVAANTILNFPPERLMIIPRQANHKQAWIPGVLPKAPCKRPQHHCRPWSLVVAASSSIVWVLYGSLLLLLFSLRVFGISWLAFIEQLEKQVRTCFAICRCPLQPTPPRAFICTSTPTSTLPERWYLSCSRDLFRSLDLQPFVARRSSECCVAFSALLLTACTDAG